MTPLVDRLKKAIAPITDMELLEDKRTKTLWCVIHYSSHAKVCHELALSAMRMQDALKNEIDSGTADIKNLGYTSSDTKAFSYGGDLDYFVKNIKTNNLDAMMRYARSATEIIVNNQDGIGGRVRTFSMLNGNSLGGGLEIGLSCQMCYVSPDINVGFPEIKVGLYPGMGAISLIGRDQKNLYQRMLLNGEEFKADNPDISHLFSGFLKSNNKAKEMRSIIHRMNKNSHSVHEMIKQNVKISVPKRSEMFDITEQWARDCMKISDRNMAFIEKVVKTQVKFIDKTERNKNLEYLKENLTGSHEETNEFMDSHKHSEDKIQKIHVQVNSASDYKKKEELCYE